MEPVIPVTRTERSELLRQRIVRSALEQFAAHGRTGMSLSDIAQGAGISKQLLLYHFKSKAAVEDAVLEWLLTRSSGDISGLVRAATESFDAGLDLVRNGLLEDPITTSQASRALVRFLLDGTREQAERISEGTRGWFEGVVQTLRDGQARGIYHADLDPKAVVPQIGMLMLTNLALLGQGGWERDHSGDWRQARLAEFVRSVRAMLLVH